MEKLIEWCPGCYKAAAEQGVCPICWVVVVDSRAETWPWCAACHEEAFGHDWTVRHAGELFTALVREHTGR